jgi:hypothetical protein
MAGSLDNRDTGASHKPHKPPQSKLVARNLLDSASNYFSFSNTTSEELW